MVPQIQVVQFGQWLAAAAEQHPGIEPVVLDVREAWEVQTACVKPAGFELVCIPMAEIPQQLSQIDSTRPLACLCHHGARSQRVAAWLLDQGYTQVVNISGGIDAWAMQLDPGVPRY